MSKCILGSGLIHTGAALAAALAVFACNDSSSPKPTSSEGGSPPIQWRAAVGAGGTLVQTFDDRAWSSRAVALAQGIDLLAVTCVGNLDGWAVGTGGAIAHTTDGGQTWTAQASHTTATLRAIRFADSLHGVAAGDAGALLVTGDGGATWRSVDAGGAGNLRGVAAVGDAYVVVGDGGAVLRSLSGGAAFTRAELDPSAELRGIASDPSGHLVLAVDASGGIWASRDRGASFALETRVPAALEAVSLKDDGTLAIAVGAGGAMQLRDATGAWRSADSGTTANLHAALLEDEAAYVAGDRGTLLSASDPRAGWRRIETATAATLWSLDDL